MKVQFIVRVAIAVTLIFFHPILVSAQRGSFKAPTIYALKLPSYGSNGTGTDSSNPSFQVPTNFYVGDSMYADANANATRSVNAGRRAYPARSDYADSNRYPGGNGYANANSYPARPDSSDSSFFERQQAMKDSMAILVQQYRSLVDSIRYYRNVSTQTSIISRNNADSDRRVASIPSAVDSSERKRNFFQRIFYNSKKVKAQPDSSITTQPDSTVKHKRKFFQRIFHNPKNDTVVANTTSNNSIVPATEQPAPQYIPENETKAAAFEEQAARLQSQIDNLQRTNDGLSRDYALMAANRDNDRSRVNITPPPVVVYPKEEKKADDADIKALQNEVQALRNQLNLKNTDSAGSSLHADSLHQTTAGSDPGPDSPDSTALAGLTNRISALNHRLDSMQYAQRDGGRTASQAMPVSDLGSYPVVSVYFARNAVMLAEDQLERLRPVAAYALKNNANISLKAFTDGVGSREANVLVGIRRTEYVRSVLSTRYGVPGDRLILREPVTAPGGSVKKPDALLRRVELSPTL